MPAYKDPALDDTLERWSSHGEDSLYLYGGSQYDITKKLQEWVERQKQIYKSQMDVRGRSLDAVETMILLKKSTPGDLNSALTQMRLAEALDGEAEKQTGRARYLLLTLLSRGISWPATFAGFQGPKMVQGETSEISLFYDGHVCAYLGMVDPAFDAPATYHVLVDEENENRLRARAAQRDINWARFLRERGHTQANTDSSASANEIGVAQGKSSGGNGPGLHPGSG